MAGFTRRRSRGRVPTTTPHRHRHLSPTTNQHCHDTDGDSFGYGRGRVPCRLTHPCFRLSRRLCYPAQFNPYLAPADGHCGRESPPGRLFAHSARRRTTVRYPHAPSHLYSPAHTPTHDYLYRRPH